MFTVIVIVVIVLIIVGNSGKPKKNYKDVNYYENGDYSATRQSTNYSDNSTNTNSSASQRTVYQVKGGVIRSIRTNMTRTGYPQYWLTVSVHYKQGDFSKFIESYEDEDLYQSLRKGDVVNFTFYVTKGKYRNIIDLEKVGHRLFG